MIRSLNYYGSTELAASFRTMRENTITMAEKIGKEHYGFQAAPDSGTAAQILAHIALGPRLAQQIHGTEHLATLEAFDFMGFFGKLMAEEQTPRGKKMIALLVESGDVFADRLEGLTDELLGETLGFPPV